MVPVLHSFPPMSRPAVATLILALGLTLAACSGELTITSPGPGGGIGGGGGADAGTGGGGDDTQSRAVFASDVQPLLIASRPKGACATCHQGQNPGDGPDFLGTTAAANFDTLVADPGLIGGTAAGSGLLNRGDHTGNAFCTGSGTPYAGCVVDEVSIISNWITIQNTP
jgi:hypothetical protein